MGPRTGWSRCCWVHSVTWVPVPPPIASTLAMCHFEVSSHSCWFPFCHRLLYGLPLLLPPSATLWLQTLVLAPVTGQMSEVLPVILRSTALICMSY
ncbi:unnamed protein product [Staurois parvus]|uniref:Secreted protein n=1 Tax=Staurois parvus TaxID=386267 RepID=A0ABN9EEF6_9NEOB|nr:unnamed protein product [Staurois parvus]